MAKRRYEVLLPAAFNDGRLVADACPLCIPDSLTEVFDTFGAFTFRPDAAQGSWTADDRRYDDRLFSLIVDVDDTAENRAWIAHRGVWLANQTQTIGALTCTVYRRKIDSDVPEGGRVMAWNLTGSYVETCSCELMCPCNLSMDHGATYDFCRVTLVFNIREGQIEGTDIAGRKVAVIADTPKVMTEGNWRLGVYVDDQASDEQLDKLVKVFGGQLGGPMGALAPLVGEVLGVERAAIEVTDDGLRHSVRVGDTIDFEVQDIVPYGVESGQPVRFQGMFHPVGSDLTMAEAKRTRINAFGISYQGKTGLSTSSFSWAA